MIKSKTFSIILKITSILLALIITISLYFYAPHWLPVKKSSNLPREQENSSIETRLGAKDIPIEIRLGAKDIPIEIRSSAKDIPPENPLKIIIKNLFPIFPEGPHGSGGGVND